MTISFNHSLPSRDIVIRQDDAESTNLEVSVGKMFPLARVRNTVIGYMEIVSFDLIIGESFLPKMTITVDDSNFLLRQQDFSKGIDIITIFVGNAQDTTYRPIKNDYLITDIDSSPGSPLITFDAVLHVPELYNAVNSGFENLSSFDTLKQVAKEIGLGFSSNVSNTNDAMNRIRYGRNNIFIYNTVSNAFRDNTSGFIVFVDQFANLNFIDVSTSINESPSTYLETNIYTGERLPRPVLLKLTNSKLSIDPTTVKIDLYTPISNYGAAAIQRVTSLNYFSLNSEYTEVSTDTVDPTIQQISRVSTYSSVESTNTFPQYLTAEAINKVNLAKLQGMFIDAHLDSMCPALYMYGTFDIELLNSFGQTEIESQNPNKNQVQVDSEGSPLPTRRITKNELLSGDGLLTRMSISYMRNTRGNDVSRVGRMKQSVMLYSKNQQPMTFVET